MNDEEVKSTYLRWVLLLGGIVLWFVAVPGMISSNSWLVFFAGLVAFVAGPLYLFLNLRKLTK